MPKNPEDRMIWHLITTPSDTLHELHYERGICTLGELCRKTEEELAGMVDYHGLLGIKRDLKHMGLSLAETF